VINPARGVALSFLTCLDRPGDEIRPGPVGLVTQSGGTGSYLHNLAAEAGSGFAVSISTGNEADLGVAEAMTALAGRDDVEAIAVVLEVVRDGAGFMAAVDTAHRAGKPVVVCRIGRSERGRHLVQSHSGALADPSSVFEGVCASLGVTLTSTPGELFAVAEIMARTAIPNGDRVGVVTHSGGTAILLSDLAAEHGLDLPPPSTELIEGLSVLLDHGSSNNPIDMGGIIGGPHRFAEVVAQFAESDEYDLVLAVSTPHPPAHSVTRAETLATMGAGGPPLVHLWMAGDQAQGGLDVLRSSGAAITDEPRAAIVAIAGLLRRRAGAAEAAERSSTTSSPGGEERPTGDLAEHEAKELLSRLGIPIVPGALARSAAEATEIAARLGLPVVVKVNSAQIVHKSAIGAVKVGIDSLDDVATAFDEVTALARSAAPGAEVDGARVEKHAEGLEVIVGAVIDDTFGPVVLVGVGGVLTEVVDDVIFAPAPVSARRVRRLLTMLRSNLLAGERDDGPVDVQALAGIVSRLSEWFAASGPGVSDLEINPLVWNGRGWQAVDAVVRAAPG
jgi:acyl-CoA synthetase (NDP forming)